MTGDKTCRLCGGVYPLWRMHAHLKTREHHRARLLQFVSKGAQDECWQWTGFRYRSGYGYFSSAHRAGYAHRASYEVFVGPIPADLTIDHLCRNRGCINPGHLEPVTIGENVRRGTAPSAVNARKTHCPRGHEYTPENTDVVATRYGQGRRCRACYIVAFLSPEQRAARNADARRTYHARQARKQAVA